MRRHVSLTALLLLLLAAACGGRPDPLREEVGAFLRDKRATVEVSVLTDSTTLLAWNDTLHLPLLSVFKFPVALAVLHRMEQQQTPLDTVLHLTPDDLKTGTYSPLCIRYPERSADVRMDSLLYYSVALSDNNACDVLLRYAGGPRAVEQYIHQLGITDVRLSATEDDMHRQPGRVTDNSATPEAISRLFRLFLQEGLSAPVYRNYLYRVLTSTSTGMNKLPAGLPDHAILGHKTGSSDRTPDGVKTADNDAGFVLLPDGQRYYITVLVTNSLENDSVNAAIIATLSHIVCRHLGGSPSTNPNP